MKPLTRTLGAELDSATAMRKLVVDNYCQAIRRAQQAWDMTLGDKTASIKQWRDMLKDSVTNYNAVYFDGKMQQYLEQQLYFYIVALQ